MRNTPEPLVTPAEPLGTPLEPPRNPPKMLQTLLIYPTLSVCVYAHLFVSKCCNIEGEQAH